MAETTINPGIKRIAVVTGGNKGIGFEISKQLASKGIRVILTARDVKRGIEAVENLKVTGYSDLIFHQLDVTDTASISSLADFIKTQFGKLDILVNNAGVMGATFEDKKVFTQVDDIIGANAGSVQKFIKQTYESSVNCLSTNYYGIKEVTKALIPLLQLSNSPRIVIVSSIVGQLKYVSNENARRELEDVDGLTEEKVDKVLEGFLGDVKENSIETKGWPINFSAYIVSKAALNAYTRLLAKKYHKISVNSVHPGYINTELNYNNGISSVEEGAKGPVMLALLPEGGPSGLFFDQTEVSSF